MVDPPAVNFTRGRPASTTVCEPSRHRAIGSGCGDWRMLATRRVHCVLQSRAVQPCTVELHNLRYHHIQIRFIHCLNRAHGFWQNFVHRCLKNGYYFNIRFLLTLTGLTLEVRFDTCNMHPVNFIDYIKLLFYAWTSGPDLKNGECSPRKM